jgi:hypothetical protein
MAGIMKHTELNALLKKHDLGDSFLEKNLLFDMDFSRIKSKKLQHPVMYADNKTAWYWTDPKKYYLLADCNRFHFMWLGHFQEWCTQHGISSPAIGRAYGFWEGKNHNWAWVVVDDELVFFNWGQEVKPSEVNYDGKGSVAV